MFTGERVWTTRNSVSDFFNKLALVYLYISLHFRLCNKYDMYMYEVNYEKNMNQPDFENFQTTKNKSCHRNPS